VRTRVAAGGGDDERLRSGENVVCRVVEPEQGGYIVKILKTNLSGFIKTTAKLEVGSDIVAQFVCIHKKRVLLTPVFDGRSYPQSV